MDFDYLVARISSLDWKIIFSFALVFLALAFFLPMPYFYELYECPVNENVRLEDCNRNTFWGWFSGSNMLVESQNHDAGWDYFSEKHISVIYIPLWMIVCLVLSFALVFAYLNIKDYRNTKPIMTPARRKSLEQFVYETLDALSNLEKKARFKHQKQVYSDIAECVKSTPIILYGRGAQRFPFGSEKFSMHAAEFSPVKKASQKNSHDEVIMLPQWHFFKGDEVSRDGSFALWKEWILLRKDRIKALMETKDIPDYFTEKAYADIMLIILAKEFSYSEDEIKKYLGNKMVAKKLFGIAKAW